jgi:hypothetical protein
MWNKIKENNPVKNIVCTESTSGNYRFVFNHCQQNKKPLPVNRNDCAFNVINGKTFCNVDDIGLPTFDKMRAYDLLVDYQLFGYEDINGRKSSEIVSQWLGWFGECLHFAIVENQLFIFKMVEYNE